MTKGFKELDAYPGKEFGMTSARSWLRLCGRNQDTFNVGMYWYSPPVGRERANP